MEKFKSINDITTNTTNRGDLSVDLTPPKDPNNYDFHNYSSRFWLKEHPPAAQDYINGKNIGNIAVKKITSANILSGFVGHICKTIVYIYNKNNKTAEGIKPLLNILEDAAKVINKDIESNEIKNVEEFIATFQGVVNSYATRAIGDKVEKTN